MSVHGAVGAFVVLVLAVFLAGCTSIQPTAVAATPAPPGPPTIRPTEETPARTPVDAVTVEYQRIGGFAGYDDKLVLRADGGCELTRKKRSVPCQAQPAAVQQVLQAFRTIDFAALKPEYVPADKCCDRITHTIRYRVNGSEYAVTATDGAIPDELRALLRALEDLVDG